MMSKLFTIVLALIVTAAGSVAGYAYFTGQSLSSSCCTGAKPEAPTKAIQSDDSCELCALARKKSCCEGESRAKLLAMTAAKVTSEDMGCCSLGGDSIVTATSSVVGGLAYVSAK